MVSLVKAVCGFIGGLVKNVRNEENVAAAVKTGAVAVGFFILNPVVIGGTIIDFLTLPLMAFIGSTIYSWLIIFALIGAMTYLILSE